MTSAGRRRKEAEASSYLPCDMPRRTRIRVLQVISPDVLKVLLRVRR